MILKSLLVASLLAVGTTAVQAQKYVMKITLKNATVTSIAADDVQNVSFVEEAGSPAQAISKTYIAKSVATAMMFPNGYESEIEDTVSIKADAEGMVSLEYAGMWGNGKIEKIKVLEGENFALEATQDGTSMMTRPGESTPKEYPFQLISGMVSSDTQTYRFELKLPSIMGGVTIVVSNKKDE